MTNWRMAGPGAVALLVIAAAAARKAPPPEPAQPRTFSGALTKPIGDYSGDEFNTLVAGLNYGSASPSRTRRCRGNAACTGPTPSRTTTAIVWEVSDADSVSAGQLPANGAVVARARVNGQDSTDMYVMAPSQGRFDYFLIVVPGGTTGTWKMEELETRQPGNQHFHKTVASGRFNLCNHTFQRGARADFYTCQQSPGGAAGQGATRSSGRQTVTATPASLASLASLFQGIDPPLWIGCASGCCTAEQ